MKESIAHLPQYTQEELNYLVESITHHVPKCAMIILYGSFARGDFVLWDEQIEFGIHTSYQSDLDILVVTYISNARISEWQIEEKVVENYHKAFAHRRHATPQFIVEDINTLNKALGKCHYFYTDVVKEGIRLFDNGDYQLAPPRRLSFKEIKEIAEGEFNKCYPFANGFLKHAYIAMEDKMYELGAFELHQACERYYYSIGLVFVNYRPKTHKLKDLESKCKRFSMDLIRVFPLNTEFEKRCYDLLCRAYIESRYNKDYVVTKEELEYMLRRTEFLKDITNVICTEQIASYDTMIAKDATEEGRAYRIFEREDTPNLAADERKDYSDNTRKE